MVAMRAKSRHRERRTANVAALPFSTRCQRCVWTGASLLGLLLCLGCGGVYPASVSGRVTLDGTPLERGSVTFHPIAAGSPVVGQIDTSGFYQLKTGQSGTVPTGEYVATVMALTKVPEDGMRDAEIAALAITPERYHQTSTSGLRYHVAAGSNTIDIQLTSP